jgi:hypothetical protein
VLKPWVIVYVVFIPSPMIDEVDLKVPPPTALEAV